MTDFLQEYWPIIQTHTLHYGLNTCKALFVFFIGKFIARILSNLIAKTANRTLKDPMLEKFVINISYALMMVFVIIAAISLLGVQTASLIAILGAAGLAVGLALQGSLSNFAAGIMTIIFRPYRIGDYVNIAGHSGEVEEVDIFTTTLRFPDKTKIIIPNAKAIDDAITNYTDAGIRRVELLVGISYDADIRNAREVILNAIKASEYFIDTPAPSVGVVELADNSVNLTVRPWAKAEKNFAAKSDMLERVKYALDEANIGIPYPQREVHIHSTSQAKE